MIRVDITVTFPDGREPITVTDAVEDDATTEDLIEAAERACRILKVRLAETEGR